MNRINSSMAGSVWKVLVSPGDKVEAGQAVVILESMKMEIPIVAETSGSVKEIVVEEGSFVNEDALLVVLE